MQGYSHMINSLADSLWYQLIVDSVRVHFGRYAHVGYSRFFL